VIYTGSTKKQAEHGGFAHDDTNVMLLVSNPDFQARTVTSFVETTQVAPTILQALGLDPSDLDAVQKEGTPVLPGLGFK
jgi:arylsulfatase A-like enzyme